MNCGVHGVVVVVAKSRSRKEEQTRIILREDAKIAKKKFDAYIILNFLLVVQFPLVLKQSRNLYHLKYLTRQQGTTRRHTIPRSTQRAQHVSMNVREEFLFLESIR